MQAKRSSHKTLLVFTVALFLCFWLSRLIAIDSFPLFIDETVHIHMSEDGYVTSPFTDAALGRLFVGWWHMVFQTHAAGSMWIARTITVLGILPGLAALIAVARLAKGVWAAVLMGFFYFFSTFHMFYDRLALADPLAASIVFLMIYFAYRLSIRVRYHDAATTGVLMFLAFGAKTSIIPYWGVPFAAALALRPGKRSWRDQARWLGVTLGVALGLSVAFVVGLRLRGYDYLSNSFSLAAANRQQLTGEQVETILSPARIIDNAGSTFAALSVYLGPLVVILCLVAVVVLIVRGRWYLFLCLAGPAAVMWVSRPQEIRYWGVFVALLLLCGALVVAELIHDKRRLIRVVALGAMVAWGLFQWLPFTLSADRNPANLSLPDVDYRQYISSDASGFGFSEVRDYLGQYDVKQVIGVLANCQGLCYTTQDSLPVVCPRLNPNGQDIDYLTSYMEDNRFEGSFAVLEDNPYAPDTAPGELLTVIRRPGDKANLSIYALIP